ncbi:flagellar basal body P-ring formation chaperone FlgA [Yersinia bercovieri]|uniref:flagellar basal body P-ring formation chaperone FlgA n=1 Tax=Yersinia bercovieri TaxID=634 RepID=UPI0011AB493F|nr:flagellar basal body P-ring formation chaperone FlgA [Yersinia bercovieri]
MLPSRSHFITLLTLIVCFKMFDATAAPQPSDNALETQIAALLNSQRGSATDPDVTRTIKILTPPEQLTSLCPNPELSLAGNNTRLTGNKSVIAQCEGQRKFIQIAVYAQGTWWTPSHPLKPGVTIQPEDLESRTGSLARLPEGVVFNKEHIIGLTTTRSINRGQPVLQNQLRQPRVIMTGQEVEMIATGPGFRIRSRGKALDNAALGGTLRIITKTGQIMTGTVTAEGKVNIDLKE